MNTASHKPHSLAAVARGTVVIYDSDCSICQAAVEWLRQQPGEPLRFITLHSAEALAFGLDARQLQRSVTVIEGNGHISTGAHAALLLLAREPRHATWARWYARDPLFLELSEAAYSFIASHRQVISQLLRAVGFLRGGACQLPS